MPLGSSVFRDTHENPRFMQGGALPYLCFMLVRGFAAISLLGGLGVEDHQKGLMPLGSSVFRDTHEDPRFIQGRALPSLCFMLVRGFAAISLLGGLGVEDQQNGFMSLGSFVFRDTHEELHFMQDGALPYLCFILERVFATIPLLGGLGVEDHQNGLRQVQILLNVVYFCGVGGNSINENPINTQLSVYQNLKKDSSVEHSQ
jgi:hypothetical protein